MVDPTRSHPCYIHTYGIQVLSGLPVKDAFANQLYSDHQKSVGYLIIVELPLYVPMMAISHQNTRTINRSQAQVK